MPSLLFIPPATIRVDQFSSAPPFGARVYDARPENVAAADPDDVYLLYLGANGAGEIRKQFLARRGETAADEMATMLVEMARAGDTRFEVGQNFTNIIWPGPCYFYVVLDKNASHFYDNRIQPDDDPLHFHASKSIPGGVGRLMFDKNCSFYDGVLLNENIFRCINYYTDEDGNLLEHPRLRTFGFEIRYSLLDNREIVDPDGQNQGPPH